LATGVQLRSGVLGFVPVTRLFNDSPFRRFQLSFLVCSCTDQNFVQNGSHAPLGVHYNCGDNRIVSSCLIYLICRAMLTTMHRYGLASANVALELRHLIDGFIFLQDPDKIDYFVSLANNLSRSKSVIYVHSVCTFVLMLV
jgi:hypothetical protein